MINNKIKHPKYLEAWKNLELDYYCRCSGPIIVMHDSVEWAMWDDAFIYRLYGFARIDSNGTGVWVVNSQELNSFKRACL